MFNNLFIALFLYMNKHSCLYKEDGKNILFQDLFLQQTLYLEWILLGLNS